MGKHFARSVLAAVLLALWGAAAAGALELTALAGTVSFKPDIGASSGGGPLASWHFIGNLGVSQEFGSNFNFDVNLEHHPLLLNRVIARIGFASEYLSLSGGGYLGALNSPISAVSPGITFEAEAAKQGIIFGNFRFDTVLGADPLGSSGSYAQEHTKLRAGFWVPNVIVSLNALSWIYRENRESAIVTNKWVQYFFSADVYKKNVPYRIRVDLGYETLTWDISRSSGDKYVFKALFVGAEYYCRFNPAISITVGAEVPVYSWEVENFAGTGSKATELFSFRAGLTWTLW
jgi:hypothetical protein